MPTIAPTAEAVARLAALDVQVVAQQDWVATQEAQHGGSALRVAGGHFTDWGGWSIIAARDVPAEGGWTVRVRKNQYQVTDVEVRVSDRRNNLGMVTIRGGPHIDYLHLGAYVWMYTG
jgi:hypothetical protein